MANLINTIRGLYEAKDPNEYDNEGEMAKTQLRTMQDAAKELQSMLKNDENMPEWVQSKITKAVDYIDSVRDYMKSNKNSVHTEEMVLEAERMVADLIESHFKVGQKVECVASGMKGTVIKVDPKEEGKYYTVKREDGKEMKYAPDELKAIGEMKEEIDVNDELWEQFIGELNEEGIQLDELDWQGIKDRYSKFYGGLGTELKKRVTDKVSAVGDAIAKSQPKTTRQLKYLGKVAGNVGDAASSAVSKAADTVGNLANKGFDKLKAYVNKPRPKEPTKPQPSEPSSANSAQDLETKKKFAGAKADWTGPGKGVASKTDAVSKPDWKGPGRGVAEEVEIDEAALNIPKSGMPKTLKQMVADYIDKTSDDKLVRLAKVLGKNITIKGNRVIIEETEIDLEEEMAMSIKTIEEAKKWGLTQSLLDAVKTVIGHEATPDEAGLDKVDPKTAKGNFKDRKDKDIDNDGDVDKSDKYLHNRRQTVTKAIEKEKKAKKDAKSVEEKKNEKEYAAKKSDKVEPVKVNPDMNEACKTMKEEEMTDAQMKKREEIVKSMKKNKGDFEKRYGARAKDVMYATATKMAMREGFEFTEEQLAELEEAYKVPGNYAAMMLKKRKKANDKAQKALKDPDHNPSWANSKSKMEEVEEAYGPSTKGYIKQGKSSYKGYLKRKHAAEVEKGGEPNPGKWSHPKNEEVEIDEGKDGIDNHPEVRKAMDAVKATKPNSEERKRAVRAYTNVKKKLRNEETEVEESVGRYSPLRQARLKKEKEDAAKKGAPKRNPGTGMRKEEAELDEAADIGTPSVEKHAKGYRPKVVGHNGKVAYVGSTAYKSPEHAKAHAAAYAKGYSQSGEKGANRLAGEYQKKNAKHINEEEEINELDYSAKKAAAGKDIGKPGKQFAKIVQKAKEGGARDPEAVAGAVLKKLRAKNK